MGKKSKEDAPPPKKSAQEIRSEIKNYIQNERDTILKKWMALQENVRAEDRRRDEFMKELLEDKTKKLPSNIQKFVGTLRTALRKTMREKGGTPYSIIRSVFLYWDADKSGEISAEELKGIMHSFGVITSDAERQEVVRYYDSGKGTNEMNYMLLLKDLLRGEPQMANLLTFVDKQEEDARNATETRFESVVAQEKEMPPLVRHFVEAVQNYVATKMRNEGSTPYFHVRNLFQFYDYDYSNGLNPQELQTAAIKAMHLNVSIEQAREIVRYYDWKRSGQMEYDRFLPDVCVGVKPILYHVEYTPRSIANAKASLAKNVFIPRPFRAQPNKVLEKFKLDVKSQLEVQVKALGGTVKSWIKEAFSHWDPQYTKKITRLDHLIGAAKRLGVTLSEDDAKVLMKSYDRFDNGEMHYYILMEELMSDEPHFLASSVPSSTSQPSLNHASSSMGNNTPNSGNNMSSYTNLNSATNRTPPAILATIQRLRSCIEAFAKQSKGRVQPRDVLHGTCLRYDPDRFGRLGLPELKQVCRDLRVTGISDNDLQSFSVWFDSDGSHRLDYNALVRQVFGEDVSTKTLVLPRLGKNASGTISMPSIFKSSMDGSISSNNSVGSLSSIANTGANSKSNKGRSTLTDETANQMFNANNSSNMFTMSGSTASMDRNLQVIESEAVKLARNAKKRKQILQERSKVEAKLAAVEEQRKAIIEDYKQRHPKPKW